MKKILTNDDLKTVALNRNEVLNSVYYDRNIFTAKHQSLQGCSTAYSFQSSFKEAIAAYSRPAEEGHFFITQCGKGLAISLYRDTEIESGEAASAPLARDMDILQRESEKIVKKYFGKGMVLTYKLISPAGSVLCSPPERRGSSSSRDNPSPLSELEQTKAAGSKWLDGTEIILEGNIDTGLATMLAPFITRQPFIFICPVTSMADLLYPEGMQYSTGDSKSVSFTENIINNNNFAKFNLTRILSDSLTYFFSSTCWGRIEQPLTASNHVLNDTDALFVDKKVFDIFIKGQHGNLCQAIGANPGLLKEYLDEKIQMPSKISLILEAGSLFSQSLSGIQENIRLVTEYPDNKAADYNSTIISLASLYWDGVDNYDRVVNLDHTYKKRNEQGICDRCPHKLMCLISENADLPVDIDICRGVTIVKIMEMLSDKDSGSDDVSGAHIPLVIQRKDNSKYLTRRGIAFATSYALTGEDAEIEDWLELNIDLGMGGLITSPEIIPSMKDLVLSVMEAPLFEHIIEDSIDYFVLPLDRKIKKISLSAIRKSNNNLPDSEKSVYLIPLDSDLQNSDISGTCLGKIMNKIYYAKKNLLHSPHRQLFFERFVSAVRYLANNNVVAILDTTACISSIATIDGYTNTYKAFTSLLSSGHFLPFNDKALGQYLGRYRSSFYSLSTICELHRSYKQKIDLMSTRQTSVAHLLSDISIARLEAMASDPELLAAADSILEHADMVPGSKLIGNESLDKAFVSQINFVKSKYQQILKEYQDHKVRDIIVDRHLAHVAETEKLNETFPTDVHKKLPMNLFEFACQYFHDEFRKTCKLFPEFLSQFFPDKESSLFNYIIAAELSTQSTIPVSLLYLLKKVCDGVIPTEKQVVDVEKISCLFISYMDNYWLPTKVVAKMCALNDELCYDQNRICNLLYEELLRPKTLKIDALPVTVISGRHRMTVAVKLQGDIPHTIDSLWKSFTDDCITPVLPTSLDDAVAFLSKLINIEYDESKGVDLVNLSNEIKKEKLLEINSAKFGDNDYRSVLRLSVNSKIAQLSGYSFSTYPRDSVQHSPHASLTSYVGSGILYQTHIEDWTPKYQEGPACMPDTLYLASDIVESVSAAALVSLDYFVVDISYINVGDETCCLINRKTPSLDMAIRGLDRYVLEYKAPKTGDVVFKYEQLSDRRASLNNREWTKTDMRAIAHGHTSEIRGHRPMPQVSRRWCRLDGGVPDLAGMITAEVLRQKSYLNKKLRENNYHYFPDIDTDININNIYADHNVFTRINLREINPPDYKTNDSVSHFAKSKVLEAYGGGSNLVMWAQVAGRQDVLGDYWNGGELDSSSAPPSQSQDEPLSTGDGDIAIKSLMDRELEKSRCFLPKINWEKIFLHIHSQEEKVPITTMSIAGLSKGERVKVSTTPAGILKDVFIDIVDDIVILHWSWFADIDSDRLLSLYKRHKRIYEYSYGVSLCQDGPRRECGGELRSEKIRIQVRGDKYDILDGPYGEQLDLSAEDMKEHIHNFILMAMSPAYLALLNEKVQQVSLLVKRPLPVVSYAMLKTNPNVRQHTLTWQQRGMSAFYVGEESAGTKNYIQKYYSLEKSDTTALASGTSGFSETIHDTAWASSPVEIRRTKPSGGGFTNEGTTFSPEKISVIFPVHESRQTKLANAKGQFLRGRGSRDGSASADDIRSVLLEYRIVRDELRRVSKALKNKLIGTGPAEGSSYESVFGDAWTANSVTVLITNHISRIKEIIEEEGDSTSQLDNYDLHKKVRSFIEEIIPVVSTPIAELSNGLMTIVNNTARDELVGSQHPRHLRTLPITRHLMSATCGGRVYELDTHHHRLFARVVTTSILRVFSGTEPRSLNTGRYTEDCVKGTILRILRSALVICVAKQIIREITLKVRELVTKSVSHKDQTKRYPVVLDKLFDRYLPSKVLLLSFEPQHTNFKKFCDELEELGI